MLCILIVSLSTKLVCDTSFHSQLETKITIMTAILYKGLARRKVKGARGLKGGTEAMDKSFYCFIYLLKLYLYASDGFICYWIIILNTVQCVIFLKCLPNAKAISAI